MCLILECDLVKRIFVFRWNQTLEIFGLCMGLVFRAQ